MLDSDAVDLDLYTWERYNQIVEHKTSHYTYYCPLALGCYLADNIAYMTDVQRFAYKIGRLFQAQVRDWILISSFGATVGSYTSHWTYFTKLVRMPV